MEFTELTDYIKAYIDERLLALKLEGATKLMNPDGLTDFERNNMVGLEGEDVVKQDLIRKLIQTIMTTIITDDTLWQKLDGLTIIENSEGKIVVLDSPKLGGIASGEYATQEFVNLAIAALVDNSPDTLNTLKELSDALGDDPNFATSMATLIGQKLNSSVLNGAVPQTSLTDATANRLMLTGAFGLGGNSVLLDSIDVNTIDVNLSGYASNCTNTPYGANGFIRHYQINANYATQIFVTPEDPIRVFNRNKIAGVWKGWVTIYHSGNLTLGQIKTTVLDTLGYLYEKLGDGITLDANQDLTLDFSKVAKQDTPNDLRVKVPFNVIKNLEMDNTLSPVDYPGYGRALGTPLTISSISGTTFTVINVPRYALLMNDIYNGSTGTNRWALVNLDSNTTPTNDQPDGGYQYQTAVRSITFTGQNTANLTVASASGFSLGARVMLISIRNSAFKINSGYIDGLGITETWRSRQIQSGYPFKKSNGKWNMWVAGAPDASTFTYKLMESDSLYGPWVLSNINSTNLLTSVGSSFVDFTAGIPQTNKLITKYGCAIPNSSYHVCIGWGADSGSWSFPVNFKIYFVIFSEDFSDIRTIVARTNYAVKRGSSGYLHYPSLGYYKGKWYLSAIDDYPPSGTWTDENRWDRHVFVSDSLDGVFEYHSTIQVGRRLNQGSFFSNHPVNGYVFGFGDALYAYVSGTSRYVLSGNKGDAVTGFFVYDDASDTWNEFPSNFIPIPYGGDAVWGPGYERMKDHSGGPGLIIQDSNKLFIFQDYTNGADKYQTALIEIPL